MLPTVSERLHIPQDIDVGIVDVVFIDAVGTFMYAFDSNRSSSGVKVVEPAFFPLPVVLTVVLVDDFDFLCFFLPTCFFVLGFFLRGVFGARDDEEVSSSEDSRDC